MIANVYLKSWISISVLLLGHCIFAGGTTLTFDEKMDVPKPLVAKDENPFQKQFVVDTGATNSLRSEFSKTITLAELPAVNDMIFRFDLSKWPKHLQSSARVWIAMGATNAIANDGSIGLNFSQGGVGMETDLNNLYDVDNVMVLGCDYAYTNGEVQVQVQNKTHLSGVKLSVCAIAYVPGQSRQPVK